MKYARKCDYTGKGMNTGYVFIDDSCMIDNRELFIKEIKKDEEPDFVFYFLSWFLGASIAFNIFSLLKVVF